MKKIDFKKIKKFEKKIENFFFEKSHVSLSIYNCLSMDLNMVCEIYSDPILQPNVTKLTKKVKN